MDLNELLHAHQVAVMNAGASADDDHFGMIAEYAERIRGLRAVAPISAVAHDPAAPPTIIYSSYAGDSSSELGASAPSPGTAGSAGAESENPDRGNTDA